jgi:hypothetical protein
MKAWFDVAKYLIGRRENIHDRIDLLFSELAASESRILEAVTHSCEVRAGSNSLSGVQSGIMGPPIGSARELLAALSHLDPIAKSASDLSAEEALMLAERLLFVAANAAFVTEDRKTELFSRAEKFGVHFLPVHFYSPIPSVTDMDPAVCDYRYDDIPGVMPNQTKVVELLEVYERFGGELKGLPSERPEPLDFFWNNPAFNSTDALGLYSMVRFLRPKRVVEIGCGYSSLMILKALAQNCSGELICIEPFENDMLNIVRQSPVSHRVILSMVQRADPSLFGALGSDDILVIDSSHVSKYGSDVNHEFFKIIPKLARGVSIHVHDVFLPYDYPQRWVMGKKIFWNEQYLLTAFMAFNRDFEPLICHRQLPDTSSDHLRRLSQITGVDQPGGGSYWFRRSR